MKAQTRDYTCGIASIANALECLGIKRKQQEIAKHCHADPDDGTDELEIQRGLLAFGVQIDPVLINNDFEASAWLTRQLAMRGPAILCVDQEEHWVTAIGMCGFNWVVFDPSGHGSVRVYTQQGLRTRWWCGGYFAVGASL